MQRSHLYLILKIVGVLAILLYLFETFIVSHPVSIPFQNASLTDTHPLLVFEREEGDSMLFSLESGLNIAFNADWQSFHDRSGVFILGYTPEFAKDDMHASSTQEVSDEDTLSTPSFEDSSTSTPQLPDVLLHFSGSRHRTISIKGLPYQLTAIENDPFGSYTYFSLDNPNYPTYFCITRSILSSNPVCETTTFNTKAKMAWHPDEEGILVILTEKGELYERNAVEATTREIRENDEPERFAAEMELFNPPVAKQPIRLLNYMIATYNNQTRYYHVPFGSKAVYISPSNIFIAGKTQSYLLNLEQDTRSTVLTDIDLSATHINYFTNGFGYRF